jgi:DNA-binding Lrp family transcriptional regulator
MRPISVEQNTVRYPLNQVLGTPANVRLLRFLAVEAGGPATGPEAAEHTGLSSAGARRALRKLVRTGVVEQIGTGRGESYCLREEEPLASHLTALFSGELARYQEIRVRLREAISSLAEIRISWVESLPRDPGEPLHVNLVSDVRSLAYIEEQVRQRVLPIESEFDLTIELHAFGRADAPPVPKRPDLLLAGYLEGDGAREGGRHEARLQRSDQMHGLIADLVLRDPSLVERASRHLDLLLQQDQGPAARDLREWRELLAHYSPHRLKELLESDSPRAQRLRQSSPFFAVLTAEEREAILRSLGSPE